MRIPPNNHAMSPLDRPMGRVRTACGMPALEVIDWSPFAEHATCTRCREVTQANPNWWRPASEGGA